LDDAEERFAAILRQQTTQPPVNSQGACAGGATYRIGDCPGATGFGDGIRKMHSKMKYSGKEV
jgi:hypothetical protein